jgi:hypothetical protein
MSGRIGERRVGSHAVGAPSFAAAVTGEGRAARRHAVTRAALCSADSIGTRRTDRDDAVMRDLNSDASAEASRLLESARALQTLADTADAATVHAVLRDVETMLRATAASCEGMAAAVIPAGGAICDRYRRAAAQWPTAAAPSYEQFAAFLSTLHDTADELRVAAAHCRRANDATRSLTTARQRSPGAARALMDAAPA